MPVSKKRKKAGKPVQRAAAPAAAAAEGEHPDERPAHAQQRLGKPSNPFVAPKTHRGAQRGR